MGCDLPVDVLAQDHAAPTSGAAVAVTCPAGSRGFMVSCLTQDCRISLDGTTATATNGLAVKAGSQPVYIPVARNLSVIGLNASASDITIVWVR